MSKRIKFIFIILLSIALLSLSFGVGYSLGRSPAGESGLSIVEQAWNIIFTEYVDKSRLDAGKLSQGAIKGMLEALDDPHSSYLDAETYQLGLSNMEGEIEGIGAQVGIRDDKITVIAPIADSPADKAGVRAGDVILEIDGMSTAGMSLAQAVLKIRGPAGTAVRLLILHKGLGQTIKEYELMEEIEVIRARIELTSVRFEMREGFAYIRITYFSARTDEELSTALRSLTEKGAKGIILDLRSNPGGLLDSVVEVASYFLPEGVVVNVVDNRERRTPLMVKPGRVTVNLPMVVLVDNYSASGGEVLAGALQDYGRALIAGKKTFGKGSVNVFRRLGDGSGIFLTTARWLTPKGRVIEGKGIEPDRELEVQGEDAIKWAIEYLKGRG